MNWVDQFASRIRGANKQPMPREYALVKSAVLRNFGAFRCFVACSKANASLIRVGSLHARPKNDNPAGSPNTEPIGTVICG